MQWRRHPGLGRRQQTRSSQAGRRPHCGRLGARCKGSRAPGGRHVQPFRRRRRRLGGCQHAGGGGPMDSAAQIRKCHFWRSPAGGVAQGFTCLFVCLSVCHARGRVPGGTGQSISHTGAAPFFADLVGPPLSNGPAYPACVYPMRSLPSAMHTCVWTYMCARAHVHEHV